MTRRGPLITLGNIIEASVPARCENGMLPSVVRGTSPEMKAPLHYGQYVITTDRRVVVTESVHGAAR